MIEWLKLLAGLFAVSYGAYCFVWYLVLPTFRWLRRQWIS